jgi:hypothetical protein
MRTKDRNHTGIQETIEDWCTSISNSPILNKIRHLLSSFILWQIWKERNRRIFKSKIKTWQEVWDIIHSNIKETIALHPWNDQDWNCPTNERIILYHWQLQPQSLSINLGTKTHHEPSPTTWKAPEIGYHKMNFDGASKGNPGPTGYREVIRNSKGAILHIVAGNIEHNTNNATEI